MVAAAIMLPFGASYAEPGVFSHFAGSWAGSGTISIADDGTERVRCKGTYSVQGGNNLRQVLRCASDSYRFDLNTDVIARGSSISGTWGEASRGLTGSLQGSITNGNIEALVTTNAFVATFTMVMRGNKQSVNINSKGQIRNVSITLTR